MNVFSRILNTGLSGNENPALVYRVRLINTGAASLAALGLILLVANYPPSAPQIVTGLARMGTAFLALVLNRARRHSAAALVPLCLAYISVLLYNWNPADETVAPFSLFLIALAGAYLINSMPVGLIFSGLVLGTAVALRQVQVIAYERVVAPIYLVSMSVVAILFWLIVCMQRREERNYRATIDRQMLELDRRAESTRQDRHRMAHIGEMAAGIIHDLKNPMANIKAYAEMSDTEIGREKRAIYLGRISAEIDRLTDQIYDILEYAGGRYRLAASPTDLGQFVSESLNAFAEAFSRHSIIATTDLYLDRPASIDQPRMRRALANLLNNSVEALQKVPVERRKLCVRAWIEGEEAVLCVVDEGPGIPLEIRARLFGAFITSGKSEGTGLGLWIVKGIVEAHSGAIRILSTAGQGTTFELRLPLVPPALKGADPV